MKNERESRQMRSILFICALLLVSPAIYGGTTIISQGGTCGRCSVDECIDPEFPATGACYCHITRFGVCLETGSGCYTGWWCEDQPIDGDPQPTGEDGGSGIAASLFLPEAIPDFFADLEGQDGYAVREKTEEAILQQTYRGIVYLTVVHISEVKTFARLIDRNEFESIEPSKSKDCARPILANGSFGLRVYQACTFGLPLIPQRNRPERRIQK